MQTLKIFSYPDDLTYLYPTACCSWLTRLFGFNPHAHLLFPWSTSECTYHLLKIRTESVMIIICSVLWKTCVLVCHLRHQIHQAA